MRVLFIVQGEGRGHLTQAIALEDLLRRNGHEVVEVLVGKSDARHLPGFFNRSIHAPVKRFVSPNFLPTPANKRVNILRSVAYNLLYLPVYLKSILYIRQRINECGVDVVINFYELLTGLAYAVLPPHVPQVSIGHQYVFLHRDFIRPRTQRMGMFSLRLFTRLTCIGARAKLALSFHAMDDDAEQRICVVPPLLRKEVLACHGTEGDYVHGYMVNAGFGENVMQWHSQHPEVPLHFFWDKRGMDEPHRVDDTLTFHPLDDMEFLRYMAGCKAYATTAGFESVCEAMYLGKPQLMVPAHIEQDCNAYDAVRNGAGITADDFDLQRLLDFAKDYKPDATFVRWVDSCPYVMVRRIEEVVRNDMPETAYATAVM